MRAIRARCRRHGRMRRIHLRGHGNIIKRLLIHACSLNLGLLMRALYGVGTPRGLQDGGFQAAFVFWLMLDAFFTPDTEQTALEGTSGQLEKQIYPSVLCPSIAVCS